MTGIYIHKTLGIRGWWKRKTASKRDQRLHYLLYSIIKAMEEKPGEGADMINVNNFLVVTHERLRNKGIDSELPWYYGPDGFVVEMGTLKERLGDSGYSMTYEEGSKP